MFSIQYNIINAGFESVRSMSEMDLHYNFLLGNVRIETDGKTIDMNWDWIPLLDFAYALKQISILLSSTSKGNEIFEFTESGAVIVFSKLDDLINIKPSFTDTQIIVDPAVFSNGVKKFYDQILQDVQEGVPKDVLNVSFKKYFK